MNNDKEQEWVKYLVSLGADVNKGKIVEYQACTALSLWLRAVKQDRNVMYPTSGITEDGDLYMRWKADHGAELTIEIHSDNVSWFFTSSYYTSGTEEPVAILPEQVFALLLVFYRK